MIKINEEKGFTSVDISIAMIVVVIFVTIMSSLFHSVYLSSTEAKRTSTALNYGVDIFESIGLTPVGNVTADGILNNLKTNSNINIRNIEGNSDKATGEIGTYKITLEITRPFNDNYMKKATLTIDYPVSNKKSETITLERLKY